MKKYGALLLLGFAAIAQSAELASLAKTFEGQFRFGFGVLNDAAVRTALANAQSPISRIVTQQANIYGINCFYPAVVHPKAGVWRWDSCEQLLTFANQRPDIPLRGHVPFWPFHRNSNLEWMLKDEQGKTVDRATALARLREHYLTVMRRYPERFQYWDVVNEVIDTSQADGIHAGLWKEIVGDDLIEQAFRFAREADPKAKLFYNDFQTWRPKKREAMFKLVKSLKEKGLIDGIGMQQHVSLTEPSVAELDATLARFSELGLEIHITELDVDVNPKGLLSEITPALEQEQAERYHALFKVYRKYAGHITAVMTWNVSDETSWLRRRPERPATLNWPLLFNEQGQPKAAFFLLTGTAINEQRDK